MADRKPPSKEESIDDQDEDMYDEDDEDADDEYFTGPSLTKPAKPSAAAPAPSAPVASAPPPVNVDMTIQARYNNLLMPLFVPKTGKLIDLKHQIFELTGVTPDQQKVKVASWPSQLGDTVLLSVLGLSNNDEIRIEPRGGDPPTALEVFIGGEATTAKRTSSSGAKSAAAGHGHGVGPAQVQSGAGSLKHEQLMALMESLTPPKGFKEIFDAKYGNAHPRFFDGSFAEAVRAAQNRQRTIIVYLHFPHHESTFPFCCATLCAPALATFINDNFIFWLGTADAEGEGLPAEPSAKAKDIIKTLAITGFPVLAVVAHMRGFLSVLQVLQGVLDPDELLTRFMTIQENTAPLLAANAGGHHGMSARDQEKAEAARLLREEQEAAYEASLREDRMKNELKVAMETMEKERKAKADAEAAAAEAAHKEAQRLKQEEKNRKAKEAQARLSVEPSAGATATNIAFRMADGSRIQRRFLRTDQASILFDYLDSAQQALVGTNYMLVSTVPKRTIKRQDPNETLEALGLVPQAMLHVKVE